MPIRVYFIDDITDGQHIMRGLTHPTKTMSRDAFVGLQREAQRAIAPSGRDRLAYVQAQVDWLAEHHGFEPIEVVSFLDAPPEGDER